ncbi:MAG: mercuric transporter MerT family protein [Candidatus Hodarchaeales archaeon]|jgi:mercuric ion transport protein
MFDNTNRKALLTSIGSLLAGFLASLCCIGPLIFVILGLSGAAFFAKLEQYRWIFGSMALGFLALGFFFTYRGGQDCEPGTSCAVNPKRRRFNKIILWTATILVTAFIFSPNIIGFFIS